MKLLYNSEKYNKQPARMLQEMLLLFVTVRRNRILRRKFFRKHKEQNGIRCNLEVSILRLET